MVYWVAITTFQTGLPFFVTSLLKLPETTTTIYFVLMTGVSVLFYLPVNILANKVGKKRLLLVAFVIFTCAFAFAGALGSAVLGFIPAMAQGLVLSIVGAIPMAAFGILPQAIVANIADASSKTTGQDRQGMFYAARTFAMKMGQSVAMLLFTGVSTIGARPCCAVWAASCSRSTTKRRCWACWRRDDVAGCRRGIHAERCG